MYVSFETVSFIGQDLMSPRDPPVSTFLVLRLQTCATLPGIFFFFFMWVQESNSGTCSCKVSTLPGP